LPERSLHYWLNQLVELGYVARRRPLIDRRFARAVRFVLDDPMLRFWFRFVFPHRSFIQQRGAHTAWSELISGEIDGYFGSCFERLAREALPGLYARERVAASYLIGEYWDRDVQIDVVGVRDDGRTDLGEVKWRSVRSTTQLIGELDAKVARYPNVRNATIERRFFVRARPRTRSPLPGHWHDLEDLYAR
jgi:AAA+ ATPase superfamily predicted ATPase